MKKLILLVLALAFYSAGFSQTVTYTCIMHPEIHAPKPGNCPKCGMVLIKEKPKAVKKPVAKKPPVTITKKDAEVTKPVVVPANDTTEIKKDKEPSVSKEPEPVKKVNVISKVAPVATQTGAVRFICKRYHRKLYRQTQKSNCSKWSDTNAHSYIYRR